MYCIFPGTQLEVVLLQSFWMLLASRMLVGIGEASYATIAPTIIADLFPVEKRLRVLSVFYLAMPFGSALGYIQGSKVSSLARTIYHSKSDGYDSWKWALRVRSLTIRMLCVICCVCGCRSLLYQLWY